ncbi:MAG: hypothetical protein RLZZ210_1067 [Pseudomonadota bacterium]|jgi:transposase
MKYTLEFRQKVFAVKEKYNLTDEETAKRFDISKRTIFRWRIRLEPIRKYNIVKRKINLELLREDVEKYPDSYQYERASRFNVVQSTINKALKKLNITHKKKSKPPKKK